MKKILISIAAMLSLVASAMTVINAGIYNGTGTTTAKAVILPQAGKIALVNLNAACTGTVTAINKYFAAVKSTVSAAVTTAAPFSVYCNADGTIGGYTPTSSDYFIATSAAGAPTLYSISAVGGITTNTAAGGPVYRTAYTLSVTNGASASFKVDTPVYIVPAANIITESYSATAINNALYQGVGEAFMPVAVTATGTGAVRVSGAFEVWK